MFLNKNTTVKVVNTVNKPLKRYSFRDMYKVLPFEDYGTDVHRTLEDRGHVLVNDNGSVKSFTGVPGYEYVVLVEQAEVDYMVCVETFHAYVQWMRKYSMVTHLIEHFLPAQQ